MTLSDRAVAYAAAFPDRPRLQVVREQGRDVLYGTWLGGQDYRQTSALYGAYPKGYVDRVMSLFPDVDEGDVLHAFSGSLPPGRYVRLDVNPARRPDIVASVYDVREALDHAYPAARFRPRLILADPPYSSADAEHYETRMVDRRRAVAALATVTRVGGFLVWLDTVWPMHAKRDWRTVGRIAYIRSTNHRVRLVSIFERQAS